MSDMIARLLMLTLIICIGLMSLYAKPKGTVYKQWSNSLVREAIIRELGNPAVNVQDIKFVGRRADLNNDRHSELLVWVPTIGYGGTSGYPLLIFRTEGQQLKLLSKFGQVWTPLVVLRTSRYGWHDIVMQMGGGGVPMEYVIFRHDGKVYPDSPESVKANRIRGRWLIGKDWKMSVMGPLPQQ
jgi:hypothetical protein